jgi:anti-sigma factor RsiW
VRRVETQLGGEHLLAIDFVSQLMHTCRDAVDVLRAYVDGDLEDSERRELESHLGRCEPCVEFLETYKKTPGLCRKALQAQMPKDLADSLTAFLRKHTVD